MKELTEFGHGRVLPEPPSADAREVVSTPAPFATFWQGPVDPLTYTCLVSFTRHRAGLRLYSYDLALDVPPGVEVADARLIIPDETCRARYLVEGRPSLARFANFFRYEMIRMTRSCWVDADILCLKSPAFSGEDLIFGRQDDWGKHAFNCAVLKFPTEHPVLRSLIEEATQGIDVDSSWGTLGPELLTRLIRKHDIQRLSKKRFDFYPIGPGGFWKMLMPGRYEEVCKATRDSTFVHLWQQMFRWSNYDSTMAPPVGSFLHQQCASLGTLQRFSGVYGEPELREILGDAIKE